MFNSYFRWQSTVNTPRLALITLLAFVFNLWATDLLNSAYAASAFPVPYWEAQLSFDHQKLKAWYGYLQSKGTFDQYVKTQHIDFVFIASVVVLHMSALLLISRFVPSQSIAHRLLVWAALLSIIGPAADALENGISYFMLANPTSFEPKLALAYSSMAALKFAMFTAAYIAAVVGLLVSIFIRGARLWPRQ